jgi:predicted nucleotidyltransferase
MMDAVDNMDTMGIANVRIPTNEVATFCRRNHIRKLSVFGSALRPDFHADSDLDILVEFQEGHTPGLAFFGMEEELSKMFGRKVDLNTPAFLSRYFRDQVMQEAMTAYEQSH